MKSNIMRLFVLTAATLIVRIAATAGTVAGFLNYFEHEPGTRHVVNPETTTTLERDLKMKVRGANTYALVDADSTQLNDIRSRLADIDDSKYTPIINQKNADGEIITRIFMDNDSKKSIKRMMVVVINDDDVIVSFVRGLIPNR